MTTLVDKSKVPWWVSNLIVPLVNLILALLVSGLFIFIAGENPVQAVKLIIYGSFGYVEGFAYTLYYTTNFIFTGLAFAVAFHCRLFNIGGEVSMPNSEMNLLEENRVTFLDERIKDMNNKLPSLKEFILPGGDKLCSKIHILRSISRRVERSCVKVMEEGMNIRFWLLYLNRLSDYFFVLSRYLSQEKGGDEILWDRNK